MKNFKLVTKILSIIALIAVTLTFQSCESKSIDSDKSETFKFPELIQRSEKIMMGKEWDQVQNDYSIFTKDICKDENDNESRVKLAQLYIKEARVTGEHGHYYPAALKVLDQALTNEKLSPDMQFLALMTKAGVQLSLHEFAKAKNTGTAAVLLNPANAQIHGVLVDANVELGDYEKAIALADKMMSIKPDIRSYSRVAYLREIHGDIDGSINAMSMAIKSGYPGTEETAWAMLTLGDMYKEYGQLDNAEKVYNNILELRPDYPFAIGALGDLYMTRGEDDKAEATLKEAMSIIPEVGFYISLAELYKNQGREEEMKELLDEIMIMLKDDTDSGHNMNLEYVHLYLHFMDDNETALKYAKKEYEKRPDNIDVNRALAQVYIAMGNNDQAMAHLEVAGKTNSKKPEYLDLRSSLLFIHGPS